MFEYVCPKCTTATQTAAIPNGEIVACTQCGQQFRVVVEGKNNVTLLREGAPPPAPAPAPPPAVSGAWLIGICGGSGLTVAAVIIIIWALLGRGPGEQGRSGELVVAEATSKQDPAKAPVPNDAAAKEAAAKEAAAQLAAAKEAAAKEAAAKEAAAKEAAAKEAAAKEAAAKEAAAKEAAAQLAAAKEAAAKEAAAKEAAAKEAAAKEAAAKEAAAKEAAANEAAVRLTKLRMALKDADAGKRAQAATALAGLGPQAQECFAALLQALRKPREVELVRKAVLRALGEIGPPPKGALPAVIEALADRDCLQARLYAVGALGQLGTGDRSAVAALAKALADPEAEVRDRVAGVLGKVHKDLRAGVFPALIGALRDKEGAVRLAVGRALRDLGPPPADNAPALRTLLADRAAPREGRAYAAGALAEFGTSSIPALCEALRGDTDVDVLCSAAAALGILKASTPDAGQALSTAIAHAEKRVQLAAVGALVKIGAQRSTWRPFVKALTCADADCRRAATVALPALTRLCKDSPGDLGTTAELVADLTAILNSPEPTARAFAAGALGRLGEAAVAALPALDKALRDESAPVRQGAAKALKGFGAQAAPAAVNLAEALKDTDPSVRHHAADALLAIGPKALKAVPNLTAIVSKHDDTELRMKAIDALGAIGPQAAAAVAALLDRLPEDKVLQQADGETYMTLWNKAVNALARIGQPARKRITGQTGLLKRAKDQKQPDWHLVTGLALVIAKSLSPKDNVKPYLGQIESYALKPMSQARDRCRQFAANVAAQAAQGNARARQIYELNTHNAEYLDRLIRRVEEAVVLLK